VRDMSISGACLFDPWNDHEASFPLSPRTAGTS